jgi:DNA-binding MarR family transcriptional regulator
LRLWLKLLKATKHVEAKLRENFRTAFDTTLPRFDVMAALYRAEQGLKMSELSSVLRVSNGNVTGIVDRLVDDGILVRVPVDNDRRATTVRLTKAGREQFAAMAARHEAWIDEPCSAASMSPRCSDGPISSNASPARVPRERTERMPTETRAISD